MKGWINVLWFVFVTCGSYSPPCAYVLSQLDCRLVGKDYAPPIGSSSQARPQDPLLASLRADEGCTPNNTLVKPGIMSDTSNLGDANTKLLRNRCPCTSRMGLHVRHCSPLVLRRR